MNNKELLLAISDIMDIKLKPLKEDVAELKGDVTVLKEDVAELKGDVTVLKEDVAELKEDVTLLQNGMKRLELLNENDVLPRLQNIEACYTSTYRRYSDGIEQIDTMQSDIDVLKTVVVEHSEKLQKIS